MNKLLIIFLFVILSFNSKAQSSELSGYELLNKYFTNNEIRELEQLLIYVDNIISCNQDLPSDFKNCYISNLNKLLAVDDYTPPYFATFKTIDLFENISPTLFHKIWQFRIIPHKHEGDVIDSVEVFEHRIINSTYLKFIGDLRSSNEHLKDYYESIIAAGAFELPITYRGYQYFDPNNPLERLLISVDIITYNIPQNLCPYRYEKYSPVNKLQKIQSSNEAYRKNK